MPVRKRKMVIVTCRNCGVVYQQRKDHYDRKRAEIKDLCPICSCLNLSGYAHQCGYIIRNYRSYPRQYWHILEPMAKKNTQIKEHRANMAIFLGRPLTSDEVVHHKNGDKKDNRVDNLELLNLHTHCCGFNVQDVLADNERLRKENERLKRMLYAYTQD